jgi:predicted metal-dependent enzyme (double-stranded beta helix superfamily)
MANRERGSANNDLRRFVHGLAEVVDLHPAEEQVLEHGAALLRGLIAHDDWLPRECATPHPLHYRQYLLHCDGREHFCVVAFVWGPGQSTPIHDHGVWGLVGVLRGAELNQRFARGTAGKLVSVGPPERLEPGTVIAVSPRVGDLHSVANAYDDRESISIHVYGGNIGAIERATYDAAGRAIPFVSGYSNRSIPNIWEK